MSSDGVRKGTVEEYNVNNRSGSIVPDDGSERVLVDRSTTIKTDSIYNLLKGESVEYVVEHDDKGRLKASKVTGPGGENVKGLTFIGSFGGCTVCGEPGHVARDCSLRTYGCDNCGADGHDTKECLWVNE